MQVGVVLPQVGTDWDRVAEYAAWAEEVGADSVWVVDHVLGFPPDRGILEGWTEMTAVAAITERVEVGAQVLCQSFRNPALLAKMVATLDRISSGRTRTLIGAGWHEPEYRAFGWDFPDAGQRMEELRDTIRILKGLLNAHEGGFTYDGQHYSTSDAVNLPLPVQQPYPVEVGGAGERMMKLIAEEADGWNCPAMALGIWSDRRALLAEACEAAGRTIDDVRLTCQIVCAVGDAEAQSHPGVEMFKPDLGLVGSVEQATQRAGELLEAGMEGFYCVIAPGSKGRACFERLVGEVKPQLAT